MNLQPFTAMLMFAYVLLMVPLLYVIDSRLSASKLVRKATQNLIIIALTLLVLQRDDAFILRPSRRCPAADVTRPPGVWPADISTASAR